MIEKLLLLHFIADFLCQPREMGTKKSSSLWWLSGHLAIQFVFFAPFTSIKFALANCAVHGVIDWFIWRGYKWSVAKRLYDDEGFPWVQGESQGFPHHSLMSDPDHSFIPPKPPEWRFWLDHWFYATIGFDQMLHGLTLVILARTLL